MHHSILMKYPGPIAVLGLGFGDEGKGATVDGLTRLREETTMVVRFNGGSQAAHHVVTPEGKVHCFSQFGSGTLARKGIRTFLSRFVVVDPVGLELEAAALEGLGVQNPLRLVSVEDTAILTTPFHQLLGRAREMARGASKHGSCGKGIGIAWLDQRHGTPGVTWGHIRQGGLRQAMLRIREEKLEEIRLPFLFDHLDQTHRDLLEKLSKDQYLDELLGRYHRICNATTHSFEMPKASEVIFEGAQGAMLDADLGFYPFVTPSYTGARNALEIAKEHGWDPPFCLGILRAYSSRHGAGPFVVEDEKLAPYLPEMHNETGRWQGAMRVGWFDAVAARYGIRVAGKVDGLMLTHLDRMEGWPKIGVCQAWNYSKDPPSDFPSDFSPKMDQGPKWLWDLPPLEGTLEQRTRWASWIAQCQPAFRILEGYQNRLEQNYQQYLAWISEELETPILGTGHGPKASDQIWSTT